MNKSPIVNCPSTTINASLVNLIIGILLLDFFLLKKLNHKYRDFSFDPIFHSFELVLIE